MHLYKFIVKNLIHTFPCSKSIILYLVYIDVFLFKLTILIQWQTCHTKTCQCTIHFAKNYNVTQKVIHLTLQPPCHLLSSHVKHDNLVVISQMIKVGKCMVGWITFRVTWVVLCSECDYNCYILLYILDFINRNSF